MVPVLAKMAVIIKSQQKTSVIMGNYEMAYACGLLYNVCGATPPEVTTPEQLREVTVNTFEGFDTEDERVKKVVHMLKFYAPEQEWDEQNMELWNMGLQEENPWVLQK